MPSVGGGGRRSWKSTASLAVGLAPTFAVSQVLGSGKRTDELRFSRIANRECTKSRFHHFFGLFRVRLWVRDRAGRVVEHVGVGKEGVRSARLAGMRLSESRLEERYASVKLLGVGQNKPVCQLGSEYINPVGTGELTSCPCRSSSRPSGRWRHIRVSRLICSAQDVWTTRSSWLTGGAWPFSRALELQPALCQLAPVSDRSLGATHLLHSAQLKLCLTPGAALTGARADLVLTGWCSNSGVGGGSMVDMLKGWVLGENG